MNQPAQRVDVDVVEPGRRKTHHMLLFMITAAAAGSRAHGEAEDPVLFLWVTSHEFAPGAVGACSSQHYAPVL